MQIIGGLHKKRKLYVPKTDLTRPSSSMLRECLFNIVQGYIEGSMFLDLFSGSGAMGLEALSRGASHAIFIEKNKQAFLTIKKNIELLKEEKRCTLFTVDVFEGLKIVERKGYQVDIIFADPPYGKELGDHILQAIDSSPLLKKEGSLFIEDDSFKTVKESSLKSLQFKSEREMGNTLLRHYVSIN